MLHYTQRNNFDVALIRHVPQLHPVLDAFWVGSQT
jgi:hypothetical protein